MKKLRFAGLIALAPLVLFAACTSTPELTFSSNWLAYTTQSGVPVADGTIETLDYDVVFKPYETTLGAPFRISYSEGKYSTVLSATTAAIDGKSEAEPAYRYTTSLTIRVSFSLNGRDSDTFTDTVTTETVFLSVAQGLKPVRSARTVSCHAPLYTPTAPPSMLEEQGKPVAYGYFNYKSETDYTETNKAKIKTTDYTAVTEENKEPTVSEYTVSTKGKGSYFDNEQILFLLRGVELASSVSFRSIDPLTRTVETVKISSGPTAVTQRFDFSIGGNAVESDIAANEISISYSKKNAGAAQKCVYAQKSSNPDNNVYRNVLLRYEQPVMYSHGTLEYSLKTAVFSTVQ